MRDKYTLVSLLFLILMAICASACGGEDTVPPTAPTGLEALALTDSSIKVSWDKALDNVGIKTYQVLRSGTFVVNTPGLSYEDSGLTNATEYCYTVNAIDTNDNVGDSAGPACATTFAVADAEAPSIPADLVATALGTNSISLAWTNSTDNNFVYGYSVFNTTDVESFIANVETPGYTHEGLVNATLYCYEVEAYDSTGNRSARSNQDCATTED